MYRTIRTRAYVGIDSRFFKKDRVWFVIPLVLLKQFARIRSICPSRALMCPHCLSSNTQEHATHYVLNNGTIWPSTSQYQYCSNQPRYLPPNWPHFGSLNPLLPMISELSFGSVCTTIDLNTTNRVVVDPSHIHRVAFSLPPSTP